MRGRVKVRVLTSPLTPPTGNKEKYSWLMRLSVYLDWTEGQAEFFHRFLIIVLTEHGHWQASLTPEKLTDKLKLV